MERVNAAMEFTGRERPTPPGRLQKADLPKWQPEEEVTLDLSTILLPKLDSLEHGGWAGSSRRRWRDSEVQRYNILRDWPAVAERIAEVLQRVSKESSLRRSDPRRALSSSVRRREIEPHRPARVTSFSTLAGRWCCGNVLGSA